MTTSVFLTGPPPGEPDGESVEDVEMLSTVPLPLFLKGRLRPACCLLLLLLKYQISVPARGMTDSISTTKQGKANALHLSD